MTLQKTKDKISFHKLFLAYLLSVFCFAQFHQFSHIHHSHNVDSHIHSSSEIEHSALHHHNESHSSHSHEHQFENKTDWDNKRLKSSKKLFSDGQFLLENLYSFSLIAPKKESYFSNQTYLSKGKYTSFLIIRGPPHIG